MTSNESPTAAKYEPYPHQTVNTGPEFVNPASWDQYSQREASSESIYPSQDTDAVPAGVDGKLSDEPDENEVSDNAVRFTVLRRSNGELDPGWLPSGEVGRRKDGTLSRIYYKNSQNGGPDLTKDATDEEVAAAHLEWEALHPIPQAVVEQAGKGAVSLAQLEPVPVHEFDPMEDAGFIDPNTREFISAQEYAARYPDR
jgi:hypothetical protein